MGRAGVGTQRVKSLGTLESSFGLSHARVAQLAEQGTLNPKVQGSTPCASTTMLCPSASGSVSGVPGVSTRRRPLVASRRLTAYVTAWRWRLSPLAAVGLGPA